VQKLAKFLHISIAEFIRNYTEQSEEEGLILRRTEEAGCTFLDGNLCGVYDARPHICDNFPHLVRGEGSILSRMWDFKDRACYCPIVYNTLEEFKEEVKFR
jgi:Fe-S-cluster containining protein